MKKIIFSIPLLFMPTIYPILGSQIKQNSSSSDNTLSIVASNSQYSKEFNQDTFWDVVEKNFLEIDRSDTQDKELVILLGNTGNGKSTVTNILLGHEMEEKKIGYRKKICIKEPRNKELPFAVIGHETKSETFIPCIYTCEKEGVSYMDCPGFWDTNGIEQEAFNSMIVRFFVEGCKSVKCIAVVITESDLEHARGQEMIRQLLHLSRTFSLLRRDFGNILWFVTKCKDKETDTTDLGNEIKEIWEERCNAIEEKNKKKQEDQVAVDFLATMLLYKENILPVHPLDKGESRKAILQRLKKIKASIPKKRFKITVTEPIDIKGILKEIFIHEKTVQAYIKNKNFIIEITSSVENKKTLEKGLIKYNAELIKCYKKIVDNRSRFDFIFYTYKFLYDQKESIDKTLKNFTNMYMLRTNKASTENHMSTKDELSDTPSKKEAGFQALNSSQEEEKREEAQKHLMSKKRKTATQCSYRFKNTKVITHKKWVWDVALSPDNKKIVAACDDKTVRTYNAVTGMAERIIRGHGKQVNAVRYSPSGKTIISAGGGIYVPGDCSIRAWESATGGGIKVCKRHTSTIWRLCFSPDSGRIASASLDCTARIIDTATWNQLQVFKRHKTFVYGIDWSPDSKMVASVGADKAVRVWDPDTGKEIRALFGHSDTVIGVKWSPSGKRLASGSDDKTVRIWKHKKAEQVHVLHGHTNYVWRLSWSPDGCCLVSAAWDNTIRLWDSEKGVTLQILRAHTNKVTSVHWSSDGKTLVSSSADKTVRIWTNQTKEDSEEKNQKNNDIDHTSKVSYKGFQSYVGDSILAID